MKKQLVLIVTVLISILPIAVQADTQSTNPAVTSITPLANITNTTISYLTPKSDVPNLQALPNPDGSVSVFDSANVTVYEFSASNELIRTQSFTKPLEQAGAFTKDKNGNYYIFFGEATEVDTKNMVLIKYSSDGKKLLEFWLQASEWDAGIPFHLGSCRLVISGDMIAIRTSRELFYPDVNGIKHQASLCFVLNINDFSRLTPSVTETFNVSVNDIPYTFYAGTTSHCFDQFVLPINGGFVFADLGDGSPRAFNFIKATTAKKAPDKGQSFRFEGKNGDNFVDAQLGGLVKTPTGYIFAGTYNALKPKEGARNLFILKMEEDFSGSDTPIWITNYTQTNLRVMCPKIISLSEGKHLLMWEVLSKDEHASKGTYMTVINDQGKVLLTQELPNVRLNNYDNLQYNSKTGLVQWATHDSVQLSLWSFDPLAELK